MILITLSLFALAVLGFIFFIIRRDQGSKEPTSALMAAVGFGLLAVVASAILNGIFVPAEVSLAIGTEAESAALPLSAVFFAMFTVGVIEELTKAIPLAFFIYRKPYFNELTDGIIYFGLAGLTFGILEDVLYTLQFGAEVGIFRIILSPYLHVVFTMIIGLSLIHKKLAKTSWLVPLAGVGGAILVHALYNTSLFSGTPVGILLGVALAVSSTAVLFVLFQKMKKIDVAHGRSATGKNQYCRNCGRPNPERYLYCTHCGKHT